MDPWKKRLYDGYVSTGQASLGADLALLGQEGRNQYFDHVIRRHLPADKNLSIADLACGYGRLIHCLKRQGYQRVTGVDVSAEQVRLAHSLGLTEVQQDDVSDFLSRHPQAFDVAFLMDVLEHMEPGEMLRSLDAVAASVRPGGLVVIHVPNAEGLFGMHVRYGDLTHLSAFTRQSMSQLLTACGFVDVRCFEDTPVVHGLRSLVRSLLWRLLSWPFRLLLIAETGAGGHLLSQNMLVVATRRRA